ncbi:MAG: exodeoxyribonuclease III [Betaproteobacteria bacterium]|nr:exodeoxyribonuclease III [Betaproteobacteria bacterium]
MLRVVTLNLNGIRSAARKGFLDWLPAQDADVVCVQELKAHASDLDESMLSPQGFVGTFHHAERKGYSGVAVYSRRPPDRVVEGLGIADIDAEGRYLQADFDDLSVVSLYLPSGSSSEERQAAKFSFMERFIPRLHELAQSGRDVIICGDWNIAHKEIDLRNWRSNQKNSGFLPEERSWLSGVIDILGYVDAFRVVDPRPDRYTWWSNRGQAWARNVGWRLDYQLVTPGLAPRVRAASIYTEARFSDHAPLTIDYDRPRLAEGE